MTTNLQTAERKTADKQYADSHPDRGGNLVRVNRNTLIAIPKGKTKEKYLRQWNEQYERYINRG